jgi:hypothetical protein
VLRGGSGQHVHNKSRPRSCSVRRRTGKGDRKTKPQGSGNRRRREDSQQQKEDRGTLGGLVHEGRQLFNKLERCGAPSELSNYVNETEEWKVKVTQELQSAWPTEAPAFQFADVNAAPLGGVGDLVYKARRAKAKVDVPHQRIGRDHEETNLGVFGQTSDILVSQPGQPRAAAVPP